MRKYLIKVFNHLLGGPEGLNYYCKVLLGFIALVKGQVKKVIISSSCYRRGSGDGAIRKY